MHDAYNGHFKVNLLLLKIFINDLACPDSKQPASTHSTSIATPSAMPRQAGPGAPCYKRVNGCRVRQQKRKSRPHERCRTRRRQPPGHPCGHKRRQNKTSFSQTTLSWPSRSARRGGGANRVVGGTAVTGCHTGTAPQFSAQQRRSQAELL